MPLLWRYLLRNYLQVFALCVTGFISVLLVTRFQNIARFAATGASKLYVLKFVLFQMPFVLPLAIPVSCLISSLLLFRRISSSHELTALRAAGIGLFPIAFPLLACGAVIAFLNFSVISELAPRCKGLSKGLAYQMTAINPLCLLQKDTLVKLKNTYVDMKVLKTGNYAEDVCFIMRNISNQRLGLMIAKKLTLEDQKIIGTEVTFISSIDPKNGQCFDHLIIENQGEMQTDASQLAQYLRSNDLSVSYDSLDLRMLQAKHRIENLSNEKIDVRAVQEIARRISLGLAAFTFTFVGIAFGNGYVRDRKWKGLFWAIGLMAFYLFAFIAAKSMRHTWLPNLCLYFIPHALIIFFCLRNLKKVTRGQGC